MPMSWSRQARANFVTCPGVQAKGLGQVDPEGGTDEGVRRRASRTGPPRKKYIDPRLTRSGGEWRRAANLPRSPRRAPRGSPRIFRKHHRTPARAPGPEGPDGAGRAHRAGVGLRRGLRRGDERKEAIPPRSRSGSPRRPDRALDVPISARQDTGGVIASARPRLPVDRPRSGIPRG